MNTPHPQTTALPHCSHGHAFDSGNPAAERGTRQVFFAVVATTITLLAVFAPLLFLPGYVGRLFVELAAAIAAAVAFSAFLALSLSPMLASRILRPAAGGGWVARKVDRAMDALKKEFGGLRTGRASVNLLDPVMVEAYGQRMPLNQVGTVSAPEPRLLTVSVWDKGVAVSVEKAIRNSGLGLNPVVDGQNGSSIKQDLKAQGGL